MSKQLISQITGTIGKTKVLELSLILRAQNFSLRELIDITFHADKNIAFRAAWILENLFLQQPEFYEVELSYLLERIKYVKHPSCQRHYVKILMHITDAKANPVIRNKLNDLDLEPVVEQCFDWMIDPKVKIAVKIFAGDTLFNLRHRYPWVAEELANQVKFLMKTGSPGMQFRGKKILAGLKF